MEANENYENGDLSPQEMARLKQLKTDKDALRAVEGDLFEAYASLQKYKGKDKYEA